MAGPAKLILVLAGVLLAHVLALEWFARHLEQPSVLKPLAPPMFTRLLQALAEGGRHGGEVRGWR